MAKKEDKAAEAVTEEIAVAEEIIEEVETKATKAGPKSRRAKEEADTEQEAPAEPVRAKSESIKRVVHTPNMRKRHGKNYLTALALVDRTKQYELAESITLIKQTSKVKFDAAIELHVNLGIDPRQADQTVRASVVLPAGTGKSLRVAVLGSPEQQKAAKTAGADLVGDEALIAKMEKGELGFDILIAAPDMMPKLAKLAKVLGPKGLMPNPKSGTVTADPAKAVTEAKAGKVEFRTDKQGIIHQAVGRVSFSEADLQENLKVLISAILRAKPAGAKGIYVKAMNLSTSMGPGIKLNPSKIVAEITAKK